MNQGDAARPLQKPYPGIVTAAFHCIEVPACEQVASCKQICVQLSCSAHARPIVPEAEPAFSGVAHIVMKILKDKNISVNKVHEVDNQVRTAHPA